VADVPGIVTQIASNGFHMQDGDGDANPDTSDGIFVVSSIARSLVPGQQVLASGVVNEYRPGSSFAATNCPALADACNLTVTQINAGRVTIADGLFENRTIRPTVIGIGGRIPPSPFIDSGTAGSVEVAVETRYDPSRDGIDFYESLEGMRVQINDA